jgi:hypothetical protein
MNTMIDELQAKVRAVFDGEEISAGGDALDTAIDERNAGIAPAENALAFAVAFGATILARNALQAGWRKTLGVDPPKNPTSREVSWRDALLWGAVSGAVVGMTGIVARRASSSAYRSLRS